MFACPNDYDPMCGQRIIRSKAQMVRFDFFFALHLGERFYSHTDNLFKDLRVLRWLLSVDN